MSATTDATSADTIHRPLPPIPPDAEIGFATPKRPKGMRPRPTECLNCGKKPLYSHFCPDCGQENLNYAVPLPVLLEDVFDEFLKWDGRLLRTLVLVLFRPGRFTSEYNSGRRMRYMSPFKLYLGVTTLFFLMLFFPSTVQNIQKRLHDQPPSKQAVATQPRQADVLKISVSDKDKKGKSAKKADEADDDSPEVFGMTDLFTPKKIRGDRPILSGHYLDEYDTWQQDQKNNHKHYGFQHITIQQVLKCIDDPEHFAQEMVEGTAKAMFFLMPFYALFLGMLFRTPRKYYVEHLVFAINHHTFSFFLAGILVLVAEQKSPWVAALIPVYYIYEFIALRTCYHQGKRLTLFKQFILNQLYFLVVLVGLTITALITVAFL